MSRDYCCQGGFCELVLPNNDSSVNGNQGNGATLSKRERRLQKSRERDRAISLLKWVLTKKEYSFLEETGDLVRLKVKQCPGNANNHNADIGCWIDGESVNLAKREHRPVLARLGYAEFQSSVDNYDHGDSEPSAVAEPSYVGNEGDVVVCRVCYNVYTLLRQARIFMASYHANVDHDETSFPETQDAGNNQPENESASNTRDTMEVTPTNIMIKSSSEGPNSSKWTMAKKPIMKSASFHGPILPELKSDDSDHENSKRKLRRKERDRKQMEENSKVFILVAESDEATNKLAKRLLEQKGYKVESVRNSVDCFKALENDEYSVLLVNENLNGEDAVSIGLWIRQNEMRANRQVKMRILVIVRNILSVNYRAYEATFVDGFLPMPLEGSKLVPSIQKAACHYLESVLLVERCKQIAESNDIAYNCQPDETAGRDQTQTQNPNRSDAPKSDGPAKMARSPSAKKAVKGASGKLKKKDPAAYESIFQYDENTSFPFTIVENCSDESAPHSTEVEQTPWCNLIVCQDVFDTYERFKIFFLPMVSRYAGMKILLWNYPGQAFTSFSEDSNLNNKYHADCLAKLLDHLKDNEHGKFSLDQRFFILAHGSGAAIATYFAATQQSTNLKGIILVNGLSHVDSHYASVFHDCRNVFACSPESRPDLPVYFYARFLFSPSYLSKTTSSLALNVYTAIHNPITLNGRKRLCQGVLNHVDTRPLLKDIGSPIISIHGENDTLVRAIHSSEFLTGRRSCPSIPQALRGGNRTAIAMIKGGHELFQEKKYHLSLLVEQILTGFHDKIRMQQNPTEDSTFQELVIRMDDDANEGKNTKQPAKQVEDNFIDKVVQEGRDGQTSWDKYHDEIVANQNKCPTNSGILQKDKSPKSSEENKEFDPNDYPEVKEYMSWRIKRHKKRLAELDRSARIIQCALRCFMAKTMVIRLKKQKAATVIQSYTRGIFGRRIYQQKKRELWAAMFVQRALRGHRGRCISYQKRMERKAQINLARIMRGILSRRRFRAILKKREYSATKIESLWRMQAAIILKKFHRRRRDNSTTIQKGYRGHLGRRKAALERDKYIFSRSQNSGIELGRQMLAEHKLHATKLQSELSLLNQEKDKMEKQIEFHLKEISNFERTVSELEKKMHHLSKVERQSLGVLASPKENAVREEKRRMDEEFSETLGKISDRKEKLEKLEKTFEQLLRDRQQKFGQLKNLEGKLAVLLDAQDAALESIRKKQEQRIESVASDAVPYHSYQPTSIQNNTGQRPTVPPASSLQQQNPYCSGPSEKDKMQASQLIDSTETMLKFGFMSMSLTYFSTLNMMRAMQRVAASDTLSAAAGGTQSTNTAANTTVPNSNAAVRVETWSVNDVSRWLTSISLSQYQSSFKEGAVDGSFLCELTDDDLRNTLGVEHRLHRKKILFSIRCLTNYTEAQAAQPPTMTRANIQPQNFIGSGNSVDATSPNSTMHDGSKIIDTRNDGYYPYSNQDRNQEPLSESQAKSNSMLDMLMPTMPKKPAIPLCNFEQLRAWVRHQKHENVREALEHISDSPFHTKHIRIQFIEEIGTTYTDQYDREPFNLNRVDEHGNTLMHIAAQTGNIRIGKLLLRKGANPNHQSKQGQTPGHFAVAYKFFDFASWLFDEEGGGANDLLTNISGLGPYDGLE